MTSPVRSRPVVGSITALLAAGALIACDGSASSDAEPASGPTEAPTTAPDDVDPVPIETNTSNTAATVESNTAATVGSNTASTAGAAGGSTSPSPTSTPADRATATTVDVQTDGGRLVVGALPAELRATVPLPDGAEVELATVAEGSTSVVATSRASLDDLTSFYRTELPSAVVERITDDIVRVGSTDGTARTTVLLSAGPDGTTSITLAVER